MICTLTLDLQEFVDDRVRPGEYESVEDNICAGLSILKQQYEQQVNDFEPSELNDLLAAMRLLGEDPNIGHVRPDVADPAIRFSRMRFS